MEDDLDKIIIIGGSLTLNQMDKDLESAMARGVNAIAIEPNKGVQL